MVALTGFRLLCSPMMHTGQVSAIDLTPAGDAVISAGYDDTVRLWRATTQAGVRASGLLQPDDWHPGNAAARWTSQGVITVIDPASGRRLSPPVKHGSVIEHVCLSFGANRLGVHDLAGNAWEWTGDWYAADYYGKSPEEKVAGPEAGEARVIRGGSWASAAGDLRVSARRALAPGERSVTVGFRCATDE